MASTASTPDPIARRIKAIAAFQIAAIVVIGVLTLVLSGRIAALQKERVEARVEVASSAARVEQLRAEAETLQQKTAELAKQKDLLDTQVKALADRNLQLRADLTVTDTTLDILTKQDPRRTGLALAKAEEEPRIYIQVGTPDALRVAREVQARLRSAGFNVPRVEQIPPGVNKPQVRYFRPADKDLAERAVSIAAAAIPGVRSVFFDKNDVVGRMRPKHLELWF